MVWLELLKIDNRQSYALCSPMQLTKRNPWSFVKKKCPAVALIILQQNEKTEFRADAMPLENVSFFRGYKPFTELLPAVGSDHVLINRIFSTDRLSIFPEKCEALRNAKASSSVANQRLLCGRDLCVDINEVFCFADRDFPWPWFLFTILV